MSPDRHRVLDTVRVEQIAAAITSIIMITSPVPENVGEKEEGPSAIPPF